MTPGGDELHREARLSELALRLLDGIEEDTVDFAPNYSGKRTSRRPSPLRSPTSWSMARRGIAMRMATNIPPHNLGEVIDACVHALHHPDAPPEDYLQFVKGPDFPTGGSSGRDAGVRQALLTGRGSVRMRAVADVQEIRKGRTGIVITETPYQVSHDRVMVKIADLVNDKRITGIADVGTSRPTGWGRGWSSSSRRTPSPRWSSTSCSRSPSSRRPSGVNTVALVDGVPRTLGVAEMVGHYLDHQMEVIERRTRYRLGKARERSTSSRASSWRSTTSTRWSGSSAPQQTPPAQPAPGSFDLSEIQAREILDMRSPAHRPRGGQAAPGVGRVARADRRAGGGARRPCPAPGHHRVRSDRGEGEVRRPRRTRIIPDEGELSLRRSHRRRRTHRHRFADGLRQVGHRIDLPGPGSGARDQGCRGDRGGRGRPSGAHHGPRLPPLLHQPGTGAPGQGARRPPPEQDGAGGSGPGVLPLEPEERIEAIIDTRDYETSRFLVMVTRKGMGKEDPPSASTNLAQRHAGGDQPPGRRRAGGIHTTNGENDLLVFTREGMGIRFSEEDLRPKGRATQGVRAIRLRPGDEVVAAASDDKGAEVLLLTTAGYGKRTDGSVPPPGPWVGMGSRRSSSPGTVAD